MILHRILIGILFVFAFSTIGRAQGSGDSDAVSGVSSRYVIGPGDDLRIFVWRNPELSVVVPVRPDGRITTPLVEEMIASGKTAADLARDMEAVLSEYVRSPTVNVIVTNPQSVMNNVKIVGQVGTPSGIPYWEGMTALDLILAVGGLTEFAAGNRAKVVRNDGEKTIEIKIRLNDLINKGDLTENIKLQPGDVVIVPVSRF